MFGVVEFQPPQRPKGSQRLCLNEVNTNSSQTLHMELQLSDKAEGSQTQEEIV